MKSIDKIKLTMSSTIKEALNIIESGAIQIALVVDSKNKLLGTVTDGDIRRGLLDGLNLDSNIESIVYTSPITAKESDSKLKILEKAIEKKLHQIPIVNDENIVIGIKEISELLKPVKRINKVVLMVGGLGTRLRPLTYDTPKPMLNVGNQPILKTIVEKFVEYGFVNIVMCVNYKSKVIQDYFKDGSDFGINIEYIEEDKRMGTAGALSLLKESPQDDFFVMNGDLLTNVNFEHLLNYHIMNKSVATMCVREYEYQVPYGVIEIDNQLISSIVEKPVHKFFVNAGIYILSPSVLKHIPKDTFFDMPSLYDALIKQKEKVVSFPIHEYWLDVGKMSDFEKAQQDYYTLLQ